MDGHTNARTHTRTQRPFPIAKPTVFPHFFDLCVPTKKKDSETMYIIRRQYSWHNVLYMQSTPSGWIGMLNLH